MDLHDGEPPGETDPLLPPESPPVAGYSDGREDPLLPPHPPMGYPPSGAGHGEGRDKDLMLPPDRYASIPPGRDPREDTEPGSTDPLLPSAPVPGEDSKDPRKEDGLMRYGFLGWSPRCLQRLCSPLGFVVCLCLCSVSHCSVTIGLPGVVLSSLERRFSLSSTQSSWIVSAFEVACIPALLVITALGNSCHRPRIIACGMLLVSAGSVIFTLPHFLSPPYSPGQEGPDMLCTPGSDRGGGSLGGGTGGVTEGGAGRMAGGEGYIPGGCELSQGADNSGYFPLFLIGRILHGMGSAPVYTMGVTYMDDIMETKRFATVVGVFYGMGVIGPALGTIGGGFFLDIYTDILQSPGDITKYDPRWVGAWWIPFLLAAALCFIVAIPMAGFPSDLPGAAEIRAGRVSEAHVGLEDSGKVQEDSWKVQEDCGKAEEESGKAEEDSEKVEKDCGKAGVDCGKAGVDCGKAGVDCGKAQGDSGRVPARVEVTGKERGFISRMLRLLHNAPFTLVTLYIACDSAIVGAFMAFGPKFVEEQFNLSSSTAGSIYGAVILPAGFIGTVAGGYLIERFGLKCKQILKGEFVLSILVMACTSSSLLNCAKVSFAGVNFPYTNDSLLVESNLTSGCNIDCACVDVPYDPVCSHDNIRYYSSCYAGCHHQEAFRDKSVFTDCSCIEPRDDATKPAAISGSCESEFCAIAAAFFLLFFFSVLFFFMCSSMNISASVRLVRLKEKSIAVPFQWIVVRVLGTIPGPIVFGVVYDSACALWSEVCGSRGACLVYDNWGLGLHSFFLVAGVKLLSLVLLACGIVIYKPGDRSDILVIENRQIIELEKSTG